MNTEPLTQFLDWTAALILETEEVMEQERGLRWYDLSSTLFYALEARERAANLAEELGVEA